MCCCNQRLLNHHFLVMILSMILAALWVNFFGILSHSWKNWQCGGFVNYFSHCRKMDMLEWFGISLEAFTDWCGGNRCFLALPEDKPI